jgi:hypothetical protein
MQPQPREDAVREPSDADLRAALIVLVRRAGGVVEIANTELYDAMMTNQGIRPGQFAVEATGDGIRLHISPEVTI